MYENVEQECIQPREQKSEKSRTEQPKVEQYSMSTIIWMGKDIFENKKLTFEQKKQAIEDLLYNCTGAARDDDLSPPLMNEYGQILIYLDDTDYGQFKSAVNYFETSELPDPHSYHAIILAGFEGDLLINQPGRIGTLLREAVTTGSYEMAKWLIEKEGARVDPREDLLSIAPRGDVQMAQLLIAHGADIKLTPPNKAEAIENSIIILKRMFKAYEERLLRNTNKIKEAVTENIGIESQKKTNQAINSSTVSNNSSSFWSPTNKAILGVAVLATAAVAMCMGRK
jgi:hypothetical protein